MRHRKKIVKLGRTSSHREAMLQNMLTSLIQHETITTTETKAKALKSYADRVIHMAKSPDLATRRRLLKILKTRAAYNKLVNEIAPRYGDRKGGYVRIVKLGFRKGDGSPTAIVELVQ